MAIVEEEILERLTHEERQRVSAAAACHPMQWHAISVAAERETNPDMRMALKQVATYLYHEEESEAGVL